jgi:hypothetical protein
VLKEGGLLIISFPNYLHFLWLIVRVAAEKFGRPSWINLQPIDRIFFYFQMRKMLLTHGMKIVKTVGSVYIPPFIYHKFYLRKNKNDNYKLNFALDRLRLQFLAFRPVFICKKVRND